MGVPDFVKYIARSSPGALCRLPKGDSADPLVFDFICVDATNAAQTLGLENLLAFLNPNHIRARSAIIFALDSQRDRSGTARSHRHALVRIGDLDVKVEKLCSQLEAVYRAHNERHRGRAQQSMTNPHILTSGRGVAGEADYKLLDLQRTLLTASIAAGATVLPSFLFVSEDSDVLCGALCGPAPQQIAIATKLQDVLYEPSILRLDRVLTYIATCTDAFYSENEREMATEERNRAKARQTPQPPAVVASSTDSGVDSKHESNKKDEEGEEVELSLEDKAAVPPPEHDVVRRRKQDGPMVATGVRIELADSSEDDELEEPKPPQDPARKSAAIKDKEGEGLQEKAVSNNDSSAPRAEKSTAEALASDTVPSVGELTVSNITYASTVDMVFLFIIVMGNAVNVPSLVRGATKIDAGSCWQAYCKHKYKILCASEAETGRVLLTASGNHHAAHRGSFTLNCAFLHAILDAVHYADAEARPPGEEEKNRALVYLSNAVYAALRYVIGCNLQKPPVLQQTFLDSRPLSETAIMLPSLSAVMWVLGQEATRTFTFPLHGLAKRELLAAASGGVTGGKEAVGGTAALMNPSSTILGAPRRDAVTAAGDLDVGAHLVAPVAANAWAVRGGRANIVSVATLAQRFSASGVEAHGTTSSGVAVRAAQLPSMTELLKKCLQKVSPAVLAKGNMLVYLVTVWEYALGMGVRRIGALVKGAAHVARAEGGEQVFTAIQSTSSAGNPMRTTQNTAAAARATSATGRYVYSFELRRMAPVMQPSDTPAHPSSQEGTAGVTSAADASLAMTSSASSTGGPSAAQQAIRAALGVSLDYTKIPRAPQNIVKLPRSALDDEDRAELLRLKKVAKKERALSAPLVAAAKASVKNYGGAGSDDADEGSRRTEQRRGDLKPKKRLGKRERLQRQKSMAKSGVASAASAVAPGTEKKASST